MTRKECEDLAIQHLMLIRDLIHVYDPKIRHVSLTIGEHNAWVVAMTYEDEGDLESEYLLNGHISYGDEEEEISNEKSDIEQLRGEFKTALNELCLKCGSYRERHNGACDGCRFLKPQTNGGYID